MDHEESDGKALGIRGLVNEYLRLATTSCAARFKGFQTITSPAAWQPQALHTGQIKERFDLVAHFVQNELKRTSRAV